MEGTKPKSIFDIPKPIVEEPPPPKKRVVRRKRKKTKKPKVARAGGVEVSQKRNVKGQRQITLKHKGGLTQEITIYTGDQKPRGVKAKGQTASWNMKPAKFKASRGLRDDRVYLQPPKREYFGNRYQSAIQKIMIDQKIKEAGASKNKEIADVRETANRERRELERRERAKEQTITELERQRAGLVASHNIAVRNQSQATLLGGDVGELNKLIDRRGVGSIRQLISKGEITDASTIFQLNLSQTQIQGLVRALDSQKAEYNIGDSVIYLTPAGVRRQGRIRKETDKFLFVDIEGGGRSRVPKAFVERPEAVAEARSRSRSQSVQRGEGVPEEAAFSPRSRTVSEEAERPEWLKTAKRNDLRPTAKPRKTGDAPPRARTEPLFEAEPTFEEQVRARTPRTVLTETVSTIRETLTRPLTRSITAPPAQLEAALAEAEQTSPQPPAETLDEILAEQFSGREEGLGLSPDTGTETEREVALPPAASPLEVVEEQRPEPEPQPEPAPKKRGKLGGLGRRIKKAEQTPATFEETQPLIGGSIPTIIPALRDIDFDRLTAQQIRELREQQQLERGVVEGGVPSPAERAFVRQQAELRRARRSRSLSVEPETLRPDVRPATESESESGTGTGSGSEELSASEESDFTAGNVVFMNDAQIRDRMRKDKQTIILVDNRPESKLTDGGRPAIKVNVRDLQSTFNEIYGADSKKAKGARAKIVKKQFQDFYTNDDSVLDQYFG